MSRNRLSQFICSCKKKERRGNEKKDAAEINPFVPNAPFLYPLKTLENRNIF